MGTIKEFARFSFRETLSFILMGYNVVHEKNDKNFFFVPFFPSFVMDVTVCEDHHLAINTFVDSSVQSRNASIGR